MPPRDESAAYAVEDAIIFSKLLGQNPDCGLTALFEEYEEIRRGLVNKAFDASRRLWQSDLDKGLFPSQTRDLMSPVHLPPGDCVKRRSLEPIKKTNLPAPTHESFSDLSVYSLTSDLGRTVDATNGD
jgi:2-polyprenyl-6-methoxyphenol hydroxylase-like FAD-dependent oxidoreductase